MSMQSNPIRFATISEIQIDDCASWTDQVFITLDIDWAHDQVISHAIDVLEKRDIAATWFVTHQTFMLDRLRENPKFELGIHPNFNFLLQGDTRNGVDARDVIQRLMDIVPDAKAVRSHSMTRSSVLTDLFAQFGLTHDVNQFIPHSSGMSLKPWKMWHNLVSIPYFWEDDIACLYGDQTCISEVMDCSGLRVFDFHPIHLYLNTEDLKRYEQTRSIHQQPKELWGERFVGYGTCDILTRLINMSLGHGIQ
ncbi:hypothetical protein [Terasakiella sp.]|uniref:polysaccharide deacetylase WbmS family protein n=1 Tax=Terasakiella sp. TaxID=2034861 RepID=UPI003AA7E614